jgi:hypothetical protein
MALGYENTLHLMLQLEERSKLLEAYLSRLQNPESRIQESGVRKKNENKERT